MKVAPRLRRPGRGFGFVAATATMTCIFMAAGLPIPLYNVYRAEDGITNGGLAVATVAYLISTAFSLLFLGRVSDHVGRRKAATVAALAAVAGCVVLVCVHSLTALVVGRVLQGLACGMASSSLGAYAVDLASARPGWLASLVTGIVPLFAVPFGALGSGLLIQFAPAPRLLPYALAGGAILFALVMVVLSPESVADPRWSWRGVQPLVRVPPGSGLALLATGATFVATWSFGSFYQAFAPTLVFDYLGQPSALLVAVAFSSIVVLSPVGGMIASRFREAPAMAGGLILFLGALAGVVTSIWLTRLDTFLFCSYLMGTGQGAACAAAMRYVLKGARPEDRAGVLASVYLITYAGAAVPGLTIGRAADTIGIPFTAAGYAALSSLVACMALAALARRSTTTPGQERSPHRGVGPPEVSVDLDQ